MCVLQVCLLQVHVLQVQSSPVQSAKYSMPSITTSIKQALIDAHFVWYRVQEKTMTFTLTLLFPVTYFMRNSLTLVFLSLSIT